MSQPGEKAKRGFAVMDPEDVARIASRGGKAAQRTGRAHKFDREEARRAGRLGGLKAQANKRAEKLREIAILAGNVGRNE